MTAWGATCQMSQGSILKMPHMTVSLNLMLKHDCLSRTTVILILQETIWVTVHETSNLFLTNLDVRRYSFTHFLQVKTVIAGKRKAILFVINNITSFYNLSLIVEECWKLRSSFYISPECLVHLYYLQRKVKTSFLIQFSLFCLNFNFNLTLNMYRVHYCFEWFFFEF